jgi:hypothetical protein
MLEIASSTWNLLGTLLISQVLISYMLSRLRGKWEYVIATCVGWREAKDMDVGAILVDFKGLGTTGESWHQDLREKCLAFLYF